MLMEHIGHVDFRAGPFLLGLFTKHFRFGTNPLVDEFEWEPDRIVRPGPFFSYFIFIPFCGVSVGACRPPALLKNEAIKKKMKRFSIFHADITSRIGHEVATN